MKINKSALFLALSAGLCVLLSSSYSYSLPPVIFSCTASKLKPAFKIDMYASEQDLGAYKYWGRNFHFEGQLMGLFDCRKPFVSDMPFKMKRRGESYRFSREYMRGCVLHIEISSKHENGTFWISEKAQGMKSKIAKAVCVIEQQEGLLPPS